MKYWTELDYDALPATNATYRREHKYSPLIASFDLECTNYHDLFSFMYIWQFGIEDQIVYGRTWQEFREFILDLQEHLHIQHDFKLIVFDHNLKFDFGFFRREVAIGGKLIAKSKREIVMCTIENCLEFRDSYQYSEKSLDAMGEEIGLEKIKGYDYTKIRHSQTELTAAELAYCSRDCEILQQYYKLQCDQYGAVYNIPLTATLRVKRILLEKIRQADTKGYKLRSMIKHRQLDPDDPEDMRILKHLRVAFFGGFNYCTTIHKNQIIPNVDEFDANSHYIAQILLHKFPLTRFKPLPLPDKAEELIKHTGIYKSKAMLITFRYYDLETILPDVGFLSIYTKNYIESELVDRRSMVTKKMYKLGTGVMTLTDVDFYLLSKYYIMSNVKIIQVLGSEYGVLPDYITNTCTDLYKKKSAAKAALKEIKKDRKPTAEEQASYDLIKSYLNRVYGIFVQDPVKFNYCYNGLDVVIDSENRINSKRTLHSPVLYQWGVWVAAWARFELLSLFGALCLDTREDGSKVYNKRILYCDTDSIKGYDLNLSIIAQYNANVKRRVWEYCKRRRIPFDQLDGLGEFEQEHYDYFKTIGLKQYAYILPNGTFRYHISGLSQPKEGADGLEHCYFDKFETLYEKIEALDQDMIVEPEESGLLKAIFGGEREEETIEDYTGKKANVKVRSFVLLLPKGYKCSYSPAELLQEEIQEGDPDRLNTAFTKTGHPCGVLS